MDLLSTLSGLAPEASADAMTSAFASEGDGSGCCGGELTFHATLTSLLGSTTDDARVDALAAELAELENDGSSPEEVGASVWPLAAFLASVEVATGARAGSDGLDAANGDLQATTPDDVPATSHAAAADGADLTSDTATPATDDSDAPAPTGAGDELPAPTTSTAEPEAAVEGSELTPPPRGPGGSTAASDAAEAASRTGQANRAAMVEDDAAASRAAAVRGRAAGGDAADRARAERAETLRPAARTEPAPEASRVSAGTAPETAAPQGATASMLGRATSGMADGVRRVLEAIELLENAPPPRQLTIEVGEGRLRVALEDGQVRLSVMEGGSEELDELIRTAEDALAQQGFDLGRDGPRDEPSDDQPTTTDPQRRAPTRSAPSGLRL